jgi:FlaA1/EpsC-like NDP-sugar epimerase
MKDWLYSRINQVILDACCFALAFITAYIIRFEAWPKDADLRQMLTWLPILVGARLLVHFAFGIYRHIWKFVSIGDVVEIAKSLAVVSALLTALRFLSSGNDPLSAWLRIPISVIALEGLGSLAASMAIRALRRILYLHGRRAESESGAVPKRVLLYGAGRAGIMLRKELETSRSYDVVGFVDDDPKKVGSLIANTPVVGGGDQLAQLAVKYRIDEIIICMATISRLVVAEILSRCRRANISAKIIPSLPEILTSQAKISQLRETCVEEVLGRESVEVPGFEIVAGKAYRGKRILVTGAGGSIGSELVRQLSRLDPARIAVLDKDENSIYELEQELRMKRNPVPIELHVADVRDAGRLRAIFKDFLPQIVFHAAAHKHVPLMELHPCEAIVNNVGGTHNILAISHEFAAERFVFISSDKAVNPKSVMGATKRIGELLVQASLGGNGTRFACVRFGNVLGSRGSVVPLFKKQISEGGPITITHPDMVRYFMTIQEAVQLILCAGTLANRGEIFVLDMGSPRKILELAREMILLSGLEPDRDIETKFTGLRPGEKLVEELVTSSEELLRTSFDKLSLIEPQPCDVNALLERVSALLQSAKRNERHQAHELLFRMDFTPSPEPPAPRGEEAMTASA